MKNFNWKKLLPYIVAIVAFVLIAVVYCYPVLEGKVLQAGDTNNWLGGAHELHQYHDKTGEWGLWTNSMFSGMPSFQITSHYPSGDMISNVFTRFLHLGLGEVMGIIIGYLIGFFILLRCFNVNPWLSIAGAIAIAFSSYFFIIIPAGHITKAIALGFLAPILGGIYLIFCKKYLLGAPLVVIYGIVGITLHPQMTYYIFMLIGVCICAELYIHIGERRWKDLIIGIGVIALSLFLVFGARATWVRFNQEYVKETMRGGHSELTANIQADEHQNKNSGLSLDYATAWSYGIDETLTLLVPNVKGGASGYALKENSETYKTLVKNGYPKKTAAQVCKQLPMYWGTQPFTAGPVYVGAIVCLLFVLGLIVVKGPYKWALLVATLFSIMLAWGKNFMPLTEFFFNYFPMYNKFRAVSSVLIVAEITMPLLGFIALQQIVEGKVEKKNALRGLYIATGVTGGLCLFLALFGGMIWNFEGANDPDWLQSALQADRRYLLRVDAWRSLGLIMASAVVMWLYVQGKMKQGWLYGVMAALVLVDMVPVDRRYFGSEAFVSVKESKNTFAIQPWEEQILQDKSLDYRVLNLTSNTFNDSRTSYRLKSIGGYSAAKLRRYQDLIDVHISKNNMAVINMLNTKYFITKNGVVQNPYAMGNAWFVDKVDFVSTPDEESQALWNIDLRTTAVADEKYRDILLESSNGTGTIQLTSYAPHKLTYKCDLSDTKTVVFSEIFYPHGWHLTIDGQEQPIGRVDYVLRAAVIPAGSHTISMEFIPAALKTDNLVLAFALIVFILSFFCICYGLTLELRKKILK